MIIKDKKTGICYIDDLDATDEMVINFNARTLKHIALVDKNLNTFIEYSIKHCLPITALYNRVGTHDQSKFEDAEHDSYVIVAEYYRLRDELKGQFEVKYDPETFPRIRQATLHHIKNNRHHPEYHKYPLHMTDTDIIEMVCDWGAMSMELNNSLQYWIKENVGSRWEFSDLQVELIKLVAKVIMPLDAAGDGK